MRGRIPSVLAVLLALVLGPGRARCEVEPIELPPFNDPAESVAVAIPEPTALAVQFHQTGRWVWAFGRFWGMAVPFALLVTGASARLRDFASRLSRGSTYGTVTLYVVLFLVFVYLVGFPWRFYAGYVRQHAYGLSNQTFAKWLTDGVLALGVDLVGAITLAWLPFLLIRRYPRIWWLITAVGSVPFFAFVMLITPLWIDPLFNDFGPMRDKALEGKILALAARAGIDEGRVFEVNKSVDTKAANAYVTGFLDSKRIVLWDTLLTKFDERQVLAVMGHEMGHYVRNHVVKAIAFASIVVLIALFWTDRVGRWLIGRYGERWGIRSLSDVAATPLILLLIGSSSIVLAPISLAYSRHQEREADRFALDLTGLNHSAAQAFASFQRENLGIPQPSLFYKVFRSTHPSIAERITFCNTYRPTPWLGDSKVKDITPD
ncbi:MAG: M48 family metallopeptidase [Isosphaeraceae bacterium]